MRGKEKSNTACYHRTQNQCYYGETDIYRYRLVAVLFPTVLQNLKASGFKTEVDSMGITFKHTFKNFFEKVYQASIMQDDERVCTEDLMISSHGEAS